MLTQRIRQTDDGYIIEIPQDEVDRLGLSEGQQVHVLLTPVETPKLPPHLQEAFDRLWPELEPALRYLKDR